MWHTLSINEVQRKLRTNISKGITEEEAKKRREKYGENKLQEQKKESLFKRFIKQFNDFMIIILIIAAIISAVIAKVEGSNDYIDSIIIIAIVILNSIMGVVQEAKAEKSIEALKNMSAVEQMNYVEKLIKNMKKSAGYSDSATLDAGTLYALIFLPAYANKEVLASKGDKYYASNKGLDTNKDGKITKADLANRLKNYYA